MPSHASDADESTGASRAMLWLRLLKLLLSVVLLAIGVLEALGRLGIG